MSLLMEKYSPLLGTPVPPPPTPTSLFELRTQYPHAFSTESEVALEAVLEDLQLPFSLSPFQTFITNALLNKVDVMGILPTGSGKTLVMLCYVSISISVVIIITTRNSAQMTIFLKFRIPIGAS